MKKIIIYTIACIIILASFKIPEILFEIENNNLENTVYEKIDEKNTIDVEAEKIYLVKAIHILDKGNGKVITVANNTKYTKIYAESENKEIINNIEKELLKLKEYNILQNLEIDKNTKMNSFYQMNTDEYTANAVDLQINNKEYQLAIDGKTNKILFVKFEKDILCSTSSKREIMENYIKYLDLYIIDDWKFEDNMLKSEKSKLVVNLVKNEKTYLLSIHSTDIFNNIEYVEK